MAIPDGVTRVVYSGHTAGTSESWAFGLWLKDTTGIAQDYNPGEPTAATYLNWRNSFLALMRPEDHLTDLDSYLYSGGVATTHTHATVSHAGTASAATLPPQCAVVLTLRTSLATRSGRGRMYLPYWGEAIDTTTRLGNATAINAAVDALALWINNLTASTPTTTGVVVSQTHGTTATITSIDADNVIDTQRRRRNKLTSTRHSHTV